MRPTRKCTEPVTPSSGYPIDRRRSDCLSESHQPRALRTRCIDDSTKFLRDRQALAVTNYPQFPKMRSGIVARCPPRLKSARISGAQKCTEPVAPSSGFPTDRLLSPVACRGAINLGRSVLGASTTLRRPFRLVKAARSELVAICEIFFSHSVELRTSVCALVAQEKEMKAGHEGPAAKFAEPGTLSSTFPTNLPLPRSAPRGASSYRRPVLGAGGTLRHSGHALQGPARTKSAQFAAGPPSVLSQKLA